MRDARANWGAGRRIGGGLTRLLHLALVPAVVGCVSIPAPVERYPLDQPGTPQAVAVIAAREAPKTALLTFAHGRAEAAVKSGAGGAVLGALVANALAPLALLAGPGAILALPAIVGGGAAVGFAAGAAAGTEAVVPQEQAAVIERLAADAAGQLRLPERTAETVAGSVKNLAALDAVVIDMAAPTDPQAFRVLRERGFGAAIEIRVKELGFDAAGKETIMALFMTAEARLVDTATGEPVALRGLVYVSPPHASGLWMQDEAALTRAEIDRARRTLAERAVQDLLLRIDGEDGQSTLYGEICGLASRSPPLQWRFWDSRHLVESRVDSLSPMFAWEALPAEPGSSAGYKNWDPGALPSAALWAKASDITYDLRIWSEADGAPGELVYERERLPHPQHRVEAMLKPDSTYFWSVRMRYVIGGRAVVSRWSAANTPQFLLRWSLRPALFYSRRDDGKVEPVALSFYARLTPCQWLDFVPAANYYRFRTP